MSMGLITWAYIAGVGVLLGRISSNDVGAGVRNE